MLTYSACVTLSYLFPPYPSLCDCVEVVLQPGDVLFVPHRWWHHVENLDIAVSVNTWIQIPEDEEARCKEAIVKTLVNAIMPSVNGGDDELDDDDDDDELDDDDDAHESASGPIEMPNGQRQRTHPPWLNPTESRTSSAVNLKMVYLAITQFSTNSEPPPDFLSSSAVETIETCECRQFRLSGNCGGCDSRLSGKLLKPVFVEKSTSDSSALHKKINRTEIDLVTLMDALTCDDVVQLIFDKLK